MEDRHASLLGVTLLAVVLSACMTWDDLERQREEARRAAGHEMQSNIEVGNTIVPAIEGFHADLGEFPPELDALTPEDLAHVPRTIEGRDFDYFLDSMEGYYLCFDVPSAANVSCCYLQRLQLWDCSGGCE